MQKMTGYLLGLGFMLMGTYASADSIIRVQGKAEVFFEPNQVQMSVELWSKGKTANEAQKNAQKYQGEIEKIFQQFKLSKKDYQTRDYNFAPEYEYDQSLKRNKMVGFGITHNYSLTLRDTKVVGNMIDALLSLKMSANAGVNVSQIQWDSSEREKYELKALGEAVSDASVKAEEIAKAAKVKIKKVESISYGSSYSSNPMPRGNMKMMSAMAADTELAAGQISQQVEVTVEYSF